MTSSKKKDKHQNNEQLTYENDLPIFITERSCNDIFCVGFFFIFVGTMVFLTFFAVHRDSDPRRILSGYDKFGNTCGRNNDRISGAKYSGMDTSDLIYHYSESGFDLCVSECPREELTSIDILKKLFDEGIRMCKYDINKEQYAFDGGVLCAKQNSAPTQPFIFDCIADIVSDSVVNDQVERVKKFAERLLQDIYSLRKVIIVMILISIALSFAWIILMRFFSGFCVYSIIVVTLVAFLGSTAFMWLAYYGKIYIREAMLTHRKLWFIGSIAVSVLSSLICCMTISMMKRIRVAIMILQEATKFIGSLPMIMFQPFFSVLISIIAFFILSALIFALMVPNVPKVQVDEITVIYENDKFYYLWILPFFFLLWMCQISNDSTEFVIAGSMTRWYFTRNKNRLNSPILNSIRDLIRYHFGSIVFGSFLIATLKFIRSAIYFFTKRLESAQLSCFKSCLTCCQCMLSCFENTIKFITRNAYIEMAISGKSFLKSAKDSFQFMVKHALSLVALNAITFILLWFSKIVVVLIIVFGSFYWQKNHYKEKDYNYSFSAAIITGIVSFYIAHNFMEVYDLLFYI